MIAHMDVLSYLLFSIKANSEFKKYELLWKKIEDIGIWL